MPRAAFRRIPVQPQYQQAARIQYELFAAPTLGWIANQNLAASKRGGALRLENFFPTQNTIRLRAGSEKHATIGSDPVESLFTYKSGTVERFFAADEGNIFDITAPADPDTPPAADVTGQTSGEYSTAPFETAAGDFIYAVNGTDLALLYDGAAWTPITAISVPAITGVTTSDLSFVNVYRNRLYFIEKNTMSIWYLPVDQIGGAAAELSLSGVFKRGGSLMLLGTWSLDAGDGVDDKFVAITTEGEAFVAEGSYPGGTDWSMVGRYDISPPLGKNATMRAGGDFVIATRDGIVPISAAIVKDPAALSLAAVSIQIEPEWKNEVRARVPNGLPWGLLKWPDFNMMIVALPADTSDLRYCIVFNVETGRPAKYTGWDTRCLGLTGGQAYFGTSDGRVMKCESGGSDDGDPYECIAIMNYDHLRTQGRDKLVHQARATFKASIDFTPKVSVSTNYQENLPASPSAAVPTSGDVWDTGVWDTAVWDSAGVKNVTSQWYSIGLSGYVVAPQVQVTCGSDVAPDAELVSIEMRYEPADIVV